MSADSDQWASSHRIAPTCLRCLIWEVVGCPSATRRTRFYPSTDRTWAVSASDQSTHARYSLRLLSPAPSCNAPLTGSHTSSTESHLRTFPHLWRAPTDQTLPALATFPGPAIHYTQRIMTDKGSTIRSSRPHSLVTQLRYQPLSRISLPYGSSDGNLATHLETDTPNTLMMHTSIAHLQVRRHFSPKPPTIKTTYSRYHRTSGAEMELSFATWRKSYIED
jgi:hypothetical protein